MAMSYILIIFSIKQCISLLWETFQLKSLTPKSMEEEEKTQNKNKKETRIKNHTPLSQNDS